MQERSLKKQIRISVIEFFRGAARSAKEFLAELSADEKTALKRVAEERGIGKSEGYREWQRSK